MAAQAKLEDIARQMQADALRQQAARGIHGNDDPQAVYNIRIKLATDLANLEMSRLSTRATDDEKAIAAANALREITKEMAAAQTELDDKRAAAERERLQQIEREKEQIQEASASLLRTLFTHPSGFMKQLGGTMEEAVLRPITEGMGAVIASVVHPITSGIGGVFGNIFGGAKQDPMKTSTDQNTAVTVQNSAVIAALTAMLAGFAGVPAPAIASTGGGAGVSAPTISMPAVSTPPFVGGTGWNPLPMIFGGSAPTGSGGGAGGWNPLATLLRAGAAPGAAPGGAAGGGFLPVSGGGTPWYMRAGALTNIGGGSTNGGGSGGPGGFAGFLKNIRSTNWGGFTRSPETPVYGTDEQGSDVQTGTEGGNITGVNGMAGAALDAGGMMLAMHGLVGNDRGTWKGAGEGAAGGAMIGMQVGGPWGAAIGAAVGFGVGVGEKLAGVESPEREAVRLVKQLYGVSIDSAMGQQIAALAKQKYAGHVSMAVRDPDVRKMVMLYSEATGQKMPLSATTPVGASLAESGGKLYQQASYVNGMPYTWQSSLPVMGGYATGNYPNPSGPTLMQVFVDGKGSGDYMAGNVFTPTFVQSRWQAAGASSDGRTSNSALLQQPNLIVA